MAINRRNYYRILHVQPEAPSPVITASYRTLMSKLRLHPDLGGDTAGAALINEAYAILSDPEKRRQYDLLRRRAAPPARARPPAAAAGAARASTAGAAHTADTRPGGGACVFCGADTPAAIEAKTRCSRCDSPLAAAPRQAQSKRELFGRRAVPRMSRTEAVTLVPGWKLPRRSASLRNMSMTGVSVITDVAIERESTIRLIGPLFDVLARVVSCRSDGRKVEIHAALLTAIFTGSKGVVLSVRT